MPRLVVNARNRHVHLSIGKSEEPADAAVCPLGKVQSKGLHQHHVRELLRHYVRAGLRVRDLLARAF